MLDIFANFEDECPNGDDINEKGQIICKTQGQTHNDGHWVFVPPAVL